VLLTWMLMLVALAGGPTGRLMLEPQPDLGPAVAGELRDGVAWFRVPLEPVVEYVWRAPMGGEAFIEYAWLIELMNRGQTHRFGFVLWNRGSEPEGVGDLDAMLAAGEAGVWRVFADGTQEDRPDLKIEIASSESFLEIVVRDEDTLEALFSDRPLLFRMIDVRMRDVTVDQRVSREVIRTAKLVYPTAPMTMPVAPPGEGR